MSTDYAKAKLLLDVADLANQWPTLKSLHDVALADLQDMAEVAEKDIADAKAKADAEKAAADEKAKAEAKAKADAQAKADAAGKTEVKPPVKEYA